MLPSSSSTASTSHRAASTALLKSTAISNSSPPSQPVERRIIHPPANEVELLLGASNVEPQFLFYVFSRSLQCVTVPSAGIGSS